MPPQPVLCLIITCRVELGANTMLPESRASLRRAACSSCLPTAQRCLPRAPPVLGTIPTICAW